MKKGSTVLLAAALGFLLSGCATAPPGTKLPEWVLTPDAHYSSSRYLTAVGLGDTLRSAESHAFNRLAGRFKTRVQSSERLSDTAAETFGSTHSFEKTSAYLSDIQLETDETLLNVETLAQHHDMRGRVYVLVALDRLDTARLYTERIAANTRRIESLANSEPYKLKEYAKARQALTLGLKNQQLINRLSVIHSSSAEMLHLPYKLDQLRMRTAQAGHSIRFDINLPGSSAPFARQVAEVMTKRGFTESAEGDLHLSGKVTIQDMTFLRDDLHTVRYRLLLNMKDSSGKTLITLQKEGRESHLSQEDAHHRAERTVSQLISKMLNARLDRLLDHLGGEES